MIAEVIKIHPEKESRNGGTYIRVEFLSDGRWLKTDLSRENRNFKNWHYVLKFGVGTRIKEFRMKDDNTIDADSHPMILRETKQDILI